MFLRKLFRALIYSDWIVWYERKQNQHLKQLFSRFQTDIDFGDVKTTDSKTLRSYQHIHLELLEQQRTLLNKMTHSEFDEDIIRKYLSLKNLEELKNKGKAIAFLASFLHEI